MKTEASGNEVSKIATPYKDGKSYRRRGVVVFRHKENITVILTNSLTCLKIIYNCFLIPP